MKGASDQHVGSVASQILGHNYLTTIEDHFRRARGTGWFLFSPSDFAIAKAWQDASVPLEAVLRGIDRVFENWRKRPARARNERVNSLAYCSQAIAAEAQALANSAPGRREAKPPFTIEDFRGFIARNAAALKQAGHGDLGASLEELNLETLYFDPEELERRLVAIEGKMIRRLRARASDGFLREAREALDRKLRPYRGKIAADQVAQLEKQFLERHLLESAGLPRLSLLYL